MIIQINVFICDKCEKHISKSEEVSIYDDPVVKYPNEEWENSSDGFDRKDYELHPDLRDCNVICPECYQKIKGGNNESN